MANCIQVITLSAQPVSGNNFPFTCDQLTSALIINGDASEFKAALAAWFGGSAGDYNVTTDYGGANTITIEFGGATAGYDWPLVTFDTSNWLDADSNPIGNSVAYSQNGTVDYYTLYWSGEGDAWETTGRWFRDSGHTVAASGWPGSQSGNYSAHISDANGANTCPVNPVSPVALVSFDTSAVTATNYTAGSNVNLVDNGTMVLGHSGSGSSGTAFNGTIGNSTTVTVQGLSSISGSTSIGSATIDVLDVSWLSVNTFANGSAVINWHSTNGSDGFENNALTSGVTINVYSSGMIFTGNTGAGPTINLMVSRASVDFTTTGVVVADNVSGGVPTIGSKLIKGKGNSMGYKPGDTYIGEFTTEDVSGNAADAGSTPTATLVHNGSDDGAVTLTVTHIDTGRYKISGTIPSSGYVSGDKVQILISAAVGSATPKQVIDSFVLDGKRVSDLHDIANGSQMDLVNAPNATAVTAIQNGLATSANQTTALNAINAITTNTARSAPRAPAWLVRPASGITAFDIPLFLYNLQGALEDADTNTVTVHARTAGGSNDLDGKLGSTTMTRVSAGHYKVTYTVSSTDATGEVIFDFTWTVGAVSMADGATSVVEDAEVIATLNAIKVQTDKLQFDGSNNVLSTPQTNITVGGYAGGQDPASLLAATFTTFGAGINLIIGQTAAVTLATSQPNYAPAKAGDAMALTTGERTTLAGAIWNSLTSGMTTTGSVGKKLANWVLGSDSKVLLSTDAQTGVTIPTVTTVTTMPTAAQNATAVWTDVTAGDFTASGSAGSILVSSLTSTGAILAASGLDAISTTEPSGSVNGWNFRQRLLALFAKAFNKNTVPDSGNGNWIVYQRDGSTIMASQEIADNGTTQTQGAA
jgi:hypothetical protein